MEEVNAKRAYIDQMDLFYYFSIIVLRYSNYYTILKNMSNVRISVHVVSPVIFQTYFVY